MAIPDRKDTVAYPVFFVALIWFIKLVESFFAVSFSTWGIRPRTQSGLVGIITAPLLHTDFNHLISNTIPMLVLGIIIFNFYKKIAFEIFFVIYLFSGILIWIAARDAYHIGASILIYGFIGFLVASGIFRKEFRAILLAILVILLYGGAIYGIFPANNTNVSWEGHLFGCIVGAIAAWYYRNAGSKTSKSGT